MAAILLIAASSAPAARAFQDGDTKVELISQRQLGAGDDFPGMWEYVYDVVGTVDASFQNHGWTRNVHLRGFDGLQVVNAWQGDGTPGGTTLKQNWTAESRGMSITNFSLFDTWWTAVLPDRFPSYWGITPGTEPFNFSAWHEPKDVNPTSASSYDIAWDARVAPLPPNQAWYMDNTWHTGDSYSANNSVWREGYTHADGVSWNNTSPSASFYGSTGVLQTFRIVHPNAPGTIEWSTYHNANEEVIGSITGPSTTVPPAAGDVNEDGDINGDDIDLMGEYILSGIAPTTANYDLSDDGVTGGTDGAIDIKDMDYLIRYLVETSAVDGDGNPIFGTQYGDFNLDGEIELGDLTRLGTYYGVGSTWAEGNANPHLDTDIELGDLTILGTYYGASNGGVDAIPEPATMSLLAAGACLPLFRRKRR